MPICKICQKDKPSTEFHMRKINGQPYKLRRECKACFQFNMAFKWHLNPQKTKVRYERYKLKNPNRAKDYRSKRIFNVLAYSANRRCLDKISSFDLWKIAKKQKLICPLTKIRLNGKNVSLDHIMPLGKGGKNTPDNIRLIYKPVNYMKFDLLDNEFIALCRVIAINN